jgi:RNA recognition motif-containing protein
MPSPGREHDHGSSRVRERHRDRNDRNRSRTRSPRTDRRSRDLSRVFTVFVKHLPDDVKADDIRRVFSEFGQITDIGIPRDYYTGRLKGYAFVEYPFQRA